MGGKITDAQLLKVIQQYRQADDICRAAGIKLNTLQQRVAKLTYMRKIENPSIVQDLYRPPTATVRLNKNALIIGRSRIESAGFETGDEFEVSCQGNRIILTKVDSCR